MNDRRLVEQEYTAPTTTHHGGEAAAKSKHGTRAPMETTRESEAAIHLSPSLTLLLDLGLPDGDHEVLPLGLVRHRERHPVQQLVLQDHHRVGVADGRLDEALGVLAGPGRDDLQGRDGGVPRGEALGVLRAYTGAFIACVQKLLFLRGRFERQRGRARDHEALGVLRGCRGDVFSARETCGSSCMLCVRLSASVDGRETRKHFRESSVSPARQRVASGACGLGSFSSSVIVGSRE